MTEHDESKQPTEPFPVITDAHVVDFGAPQAAPEPVEDAVPDASPAETPKRSLAHKLLLAVIGVFTFLAAVTGVWMFAYANEAAKTPLVVSLTPQAAEQSLVASRLRAGEARFVATSSFPPGVVMDQAPAAYTRLPQGSAVNVTVAAKPTALPVPDVGLAEQGVAEQVLRSQVFVPVTLRQYSTGIPVGDVVAQLPRAGDSAFTGSKVYIVVSLGPGTRGSTVPSLIGKRRSSAGSLLDAQTLFPFERLVDSPGTAADTVVDQVPAPGSTVEIGASVAIAVTAR